MSKVIRLPRAVYDPTKKSRNLLTTIGSLIPIVITVLFSLGVINLDPEGQQQFQILAMNIWEAILAIIDAVLAIFMLFKAEDGSKTRLKYLAKAA